MLAAKQAAEEAMRKAEEEALRLEQEAALKEEEEKKKVEAEREARKERERQKKAELKKAGKLLSKSEKERVERNKLKLQQLLEAQNSANLKVPALTAEDKAKAEAETEEESSSTKKKIIYTKKKKAIPKQMSNGNRSELAAKSVEKKESEEEDDDVADDWEQACSSESEDSESESGSETSSDWDAESEVEEVVQEVKSIDISGKKGSATKKDRPTELRSPICCILGHVDTGKTKLLDKIRQTNVQEGEAGGITQQIGATYFPIEAIKQKTSFLNKDGSFEYKVPGLLIIDTPGHESFTNLRSRGSSLCNIAILVVDIMHGLEPQTIESLGLLRQRKSPFIVALNKVDRLYGWKSYPDMSFEEMLKLQPEATRAEFEDRLQKTILAFSEQGLNSQVSFRNDDMRKTVSLVPTSAITGDGVGDMIMLLISLTQKMMHESLMYLSRLECTVLEVKVIEGLGTTIDVILSNGILREGDKIAVCGLNGPIVTQIRALLTPQPLRELRIKSQYVHNKQVKAAQGVKICATDLEKAIAGSHLMVIKPGDDEEVIKEEVMGDLKSMLDSVDKSGHGVCVQSSTLGSLEALLSFLKDMKIPVSGINIGPIHKKDIVRASVMLESAKEFACILAFDVKIDKECQDLADELDVKIFKADIIYHLFDQFTAYMTALTDQKRKDMAPQAVFPCILKIVPGCVFNKRDPIIMGVDVVEGILRIGTPICVVQQPGNVVCSLGRVSSIELNHRQMEQVKRGGPSVAIKIEHASYEPARLFGRHFIESDLLYSKISRQSIDVLKENFRNDLSKEDWALVVKLKKVFNIA
jgi:translation initiation factor 5B